MNCWLFPTSVGILFFSLVSPRDARAQGLATFLEAAEQKNLEGLLAVEASASARVAFDQQWSGLLPTVTVAAGYTRNQFEAVIDVPQGPSATSRITIIPRDQLEASLRADVPLVDLTRWLRVGAASAQAQAAATRETATRAQVQRQVVAAYFAVAAGHALVRSAQRSLGVAKAQLEQQAARAAAGTANELERLRASAEVERATQLVADAEAQVATATRTLTTLTGLSPEATLPLPTDDLHPEAPAVELERASAESPAVIAADLEALAAKRSAASTTATLVPVVGGQFTQRFTNATGFQNQAAVWAAGLTATWRADVSAFQGLRAAAVAERSAQLSAERSRRAAADQVHADWHRVNAALTKVRAAVAQVTAASRAQQMTAERSAAGVATQLEVIQADRDLFAAEVSDVTARLELATARASLRLSAGLPLEVQR